MNAMVVGILVFCLVTCFVFASQLISVYNGLISVYKQVGRAWANIDVILKQRHDVIPQLISVCEKFAQYERGTFDHLIEARKAYGMGQTPEEGMHADQVTTQALKGILAIGEAYPALKSSDQFIEIEHTLTSLENQLADRRELYNECVTNFNTRIEQFPDVFFARSLGYAPMKLYRVEDSDKSMPSLDMKMPA